MMAGKLIFITGGARSGKSAFAERLVVAHRRRVAFIATALAADEEMAERIARHRDRRPDDWVTIECETSLTQAIRQAAEGADVILVDCLTIYLTRLLPFLADNETADRRITEEVEARLERELADLLEAARSIEADIIIVSNEVGSGLVPPYPSGRLFRDLVGRANQTLARAADYAYLVAAGIPLDLKALRAKEFPWGVNP